MKPITQNDLDKIELYAGQTPTKVSYKELTDIYSKLDYLCKAICKNGFEYSIRQDPRKVAGSNITFREYQWAKIYPKGMKNSCKDYFAYVVGLSDSLHFHMMGVGDYQSHPLSTKASNTCWTELDIENFNYEEIAEKFREFDKKYRKLFIETGVGFGIAECIKIKEELFMEDIIKLLIQKGQIVLQGPPGTGKTLLAKAVAGEANVPFFSLSGSDFVEMFVGVGASRVRDLFKQAKEKSPAIIFIDEIDAVGRARGKNNMSGGNDERENTLNQLLTEMDGFGTNSNVIVLAATNRADVLDKALMRAGRFDRQIFVDLPDIRERGEIFKVHLAPLKKVEGLDVDFLAKQTPGFSGADIANVCNEAALIAARNNKTAVDKQDFLDAVDRIIGGLEKKNKIVTPEEKKAIAIHEAGHATVSWMLEHAAPLIKVTIVPRGQSLGAAWYLPEERLIVRPDQMLDEMCATMGGRAAEKVIFNRISTGALSDLEKVTRQARAMVTVYGLNEKIGNVTYYDSSGQSEYSFSKPYSDETAKVIDEEISALIEGQYQRAIQILEENKEKLNQLADILIEKEVIFKDDLEAIFGKRSFDANLEEVVS